MAIFTTAGSTRGVSAVFRNDEDVQAREGLRVRGEGAVGGCDEDAAEFIVEAGANLRDTRVIGAGGFVGAFDQGQFGSDLGVTGGSRDRVERRGVSLAEAAHQLFGWAAGDQGCGAGCAEKAVARVIVGIGIAGTLARDDADAAPYADPLARRLDQRLIDTQRGGRNRLKIKISVVASR